MANILTNKEEIARSFEMQLSYSHCSLLVETVTRSPSFKVRGYSMGKASNNL